jgi:hypothetical protein
MKRSKYEPLASIYTTHTCCLQYNKIIYSQFYYLFVKSSSQIELEARQSPLLHRSTGWNEFPWLSLDCVSPTLWHYTLNLSWKLIWWMYVSKNLGSLLPFAVLRLIFLILWYVIYFGLCYNFYYEFLWFIQIKRPIKNRLKCSAKMTIGNTILCHASN